MRDSKMKSPSRVILSLVILILVITAAGVAYQKPGLLPWYFADTGTMKQEQETTISERTQQEGDTATDAMWATAPDHELQLDYLEKLFAGVDRRQREQLLADEEAFRQFVRQEADNQSVLAAAYANRLHEDENMMFLMRRGADSVLRETYLNRLMQEQLPPDFPTREQARQFYEQNPERFQVGERMEVWQVFLQMEQGAEQDAAAVEQQARDIHQRIQNGEMDFARAAIEYSAHEPSRRNGGYMGQVRVADLKPEIARVMGELEPGAVGLAHSEEGWHILRKGEIIPPEKLEFDQIEDQVRRLLLNQARQEFRAAVYEEARKAYPQDDLSAARIERWRQSLRQQSDADWAQ